jgi:gliding motility-associated-like protein
VSNVAFDRLYNLFVTDANGCTGEDDLMVRTKKTRNVFVANAFTPNGDGNNDQLYVQGDLQVSTVQSFEVFDRWGELIFVATDIAPNNAQLGWDGTYKGQALNSGIFTWVATIQFADGYTKTYKGSTAIIR